MKKKCAWVLTLAILATMMMPGMAFATGETEGSAAETDASEGVVTLDTLDALSAQEAEDPQADLKKAMEISPLPADAVIADGVYIENIDVSGMTAEQALESVLSRVEELGKKKFTLTLEGADDVEPIVVEMSELGLGTQGLAESVMEAVSLGKSGNLIVRYKAEKDLQVTNKKYDLKLAFDKNSVTDFITEKTADLAVEPVNAELTHSGDGFSVSQSKTGIKVNKDATVTAIMKALGSWNKEDAMVAAVAEITQPERTTELLSMVQDKLGSFTVNSSASTEKFKNLSRGMELTSGTLIMPGESWSMHAALSPFSAENGYTEQIAYQDGGYVMEYGGGICQLATTLYNAALRAEVHVSKRFNHSMTVGYTDYGLDATVNDGGSKDLELTNDFDFPIYIEGSASRSSTTYTIWGLETRPSNRTLKFYGVTISESYLPDEVTVDPNMAPGTEKMVQATSYPALVAEAYKEVWVDGALVDKIKLHTDKYRASARKVVRGPDAPAVDPNAPTDPNAPADPNAPTDPAAPTEAPATDPAPTDPAADPGTGTAS